MSHLTYVKVSDLNPGEPIPLGLRGMGYGSVPPPRDLYTASTWDIYGMSDPPYPDGSDGNLYVPQLGRGRSGYDRYQGEPQSAYPMPPSGGPPPVRSPVPVQVPKVKLVESFSPGMEVEEEEAPRRRKKASTVETPISDEIYNTKRSYQLKNPWLVFIFLTAFAGGIIFFWSGMDVLMKNYFNQGNPLTWKMYLMYAAIIFGLVFLAAYLLDLNLLKIEELGQ